jgi:uncharacterized protein YjbI with pentapeptide repeats
VGTERNKRIRQMVVLLTNPIILRIFAALAVAGVCVLAGCALWHYEDLRLDSLRRSTEIHSLKPEQQIELEKDLIQIEFSGRAAIAQAVLGLTVLASLYFSWRNLQLTTENLQATQKSQITERFTRAVDQLGDTNADGKPKLEIRLGGIYSLGEIAKEGPEYSKSVIGVLTAYVRMHAAYQMRGAEEPQAAADLVSTFDVQAILKVLGRSTVSGIDLEATNLGNVDLRGAFLKKANLSHTRMVSAQFDGAQLQEANLSYANLYHTDLRKADLQGAKLVQAILPDNLNGARLNGADLHDARLKGRVLKNADLSDAELGGETNLEGADLSGADLRRAQLDSSYLQGVDFRTAKLDGANLRSADLDKCRMQGVNLRGVQGLAWAQISQAFINRFTQLPPDVEREMPPFVRAALDRQSGNLVYFGMRPVDVRDPNQNEQSSDQT